MCQTKSIETLLHRFSPKDCKPTTTPMEIGLKLSSHDAGEHFDVTLYQMAVGCLIYVCITRPHI